MNLKLLFCQFPNPWTLRVSGMGCLTTKCEKKSKSLPPNEQADAQIYLLVGLTAILEDTYKKPAESGQVTS